MKITNVKLSYFKKFGENIDIPLKGDITLFVGGNNSGKTSALQSMALWSFLKEKWMQEGGTRDKRGVQVNRLEGIPIPVREISFLWNNTQTQEKRNGKQNQPIHIKISLEYSDDNNQKQKYGFIIRRHSAETFTFLPENTVAEQHIPDIAISYLPAFSGIRSDEEYLGSDATVWGYIYQGLPGNILRNILFRIYENDKNSWQEIVQNFQDFFRYTLQAPKNFQKIFIDYKTENNKLLEINTLGSGALQVLLLIAFIYWGKSKVLLLDEPDSHEHIFLQKSVFEWIRKKAKERNIQIIISTHSEVFVDSLDLEEEGLVSFFHPQNPKLTLHVQQTKQALKSLAHTDALLAVEKKHLLFLEGETDKRMLEEWSRILEIDIDWKNIWCEYAAQADQHIVLNRFKLLSSVEPNFKIFWIRDGDCKEIPHLPSAIEIKKWSKAEIENFLLQKDVLFRYLEKKYSNKQDSLFASSQNILQKAKEFWKALETITPDFSIIKGSQYLSNFFTQVEGVSMGKKDFYLIAKIMHKEEIALEIQEVLKKIIQIFNTENNRIH